MKGSRTTGTDFGNARDVAEETLDLTIIQDVPFAPELVIVPPGGFLMGSPANEAGRDKNEGPQHEVRIPYRLAIGRYPVTLEEYSCYVNDEMPVEARADRSGWPVKNASWKDARGYAAWLSQKTGKAYRLPSEAEWEYVCRAGTTTRYFWGDDVPTSEQANFENIVGRTTEGNSYQPNAWGLHDMHGNVWEWVEDSWNDSYRGAPSDGSAWKTEEHALHVLRGGSYMSAVEDLRSAVRTRGGNEVPDHHGFRVARTFQEPTSSTANVNRDTDGRRRGGLSLSLKL